LPGGEYDQAAADAIDLARQLHRSGFTAAQRQEVENDGVSGSQIPALATAIHDQVYSFYNGNTDTLAHLQQVLAGLASAETAAASGRTGLAGRMTTVIAGLTGQASVPQTAPVAAAGGPYSAAVGGTVDLDASGSMPGTGQSITSYSWDVNGDGTFGD